MVVRCSVAFDVCSGTCGPWPGMCAASRRPARVGNSKKRALRHLCLFRHFVPTLDCGDKQRPTSARVRCKVQGWEHGFIIGMHAAMELALGAVYLCGKGASPVPEPRGVAVFRCLSLVSCLQVHSVRSYLGMQVGRTHGWLNLSAWSCSPFPIKLSMVSDVSCFALWRELAQFGRPSSFGSHILRSFLGLEKVSACVLMLTNSRTNNRYRYAPMCFNPFWP